MPPDLKPNEPPLSPWRLGLAAARANLVPGLLVQALLLAVVVSYYTVESARGAWGQVAGWKAQSGYFFAFCSGVLAGGVLPEVLKVVAFQKGRFLRANLANLCIYPFFWGMQAIMVDALYRAQAWWFGDRADVATVLKKVLVDQLLYSPAVALPTALFFVAWWENGRSWSAARAVFTRRGLQEKAFPSLMANWAVWCPTVALVYSLPAGLQVPVYALALAFWVVLFTWINAGPSRRRS